RRRRRRRQDRDRAEREEDERRHRRSRFLATAAAALDQRLDVEGRAAQLAQTCVPDLADFAVVLLERDGGIEVAAVANRGVGDGALFRRLAGARVDPATVAPWIL